MQNILTREVIRSAQKAWGEGIIKIGETFANKGDYRKEAENFIAGFYGYNEGPVLFKPTLAAVEQFRDTFEKALSYFIGGNPDLPEDSGFAIRRWVKVQFRNAGILIAQDHALAMGNYFFTDAEGTEIKVEYTFGYFADKEGNIKINLHHSSLPFTGTT